MKQMNFITKLLKQKQKIIKTKLTITSSNGFHLRPIAKFVNEVKKFDTKVTIIAFNQEVSALQVPKILSLALDSGDSFELKVEGDRAKEVSEHLSNFFKELMEKDTNIEIASLIDILSLLSTITLTLYLTRGATPTPLAIIYPLIVLD